MSSLVHRFIQRIRSALASLELACLHLPSPSRYSLLLGFALDFTRSKAQLVAENALLRQQLILLHRQVGKPRFTPTDRLWLVLLASRVRTWREALLILQPDTLLRWHRQGFRLFWWFKSHNRGGRPRLASETIALIQQMARENCLWGAEPRRRVLPDEPSGIPGERIRGELMKLGIRLPSLPRIGRPGVNDPEVPWPAGSGRAFAWLTPTPPMARIGQFSSGITPRSSRPVTYF